MLVSGIYPPETGGPATFIQNFSTWLAQRSLDVSVITYTDGESNTEIVDGIRVIKIHRDRNIALRYIRFIRILLKTYNSATKVLASGAFVEIVLASLVRRIEYTVKIPGDIVWERARNSGITDLDITSFQASNMSLKYRLFRNLFSLSIARAKNIIVPSMFLQKIVAKWVGPSKKITLIYNSTNYSRFSKPGSQLRIFDVITASRLVPWKGVDEIIQCCKELDLSLGIAGEGPDENRLKKFATTLGASVTFLGQIPKSEMADFYSAGEIFVLNSSYEGLPHALIEAKASGLLCIGKSGTGSEEVIRNEIDGLLVNSDLKCNLKDTLHRVFLNPDLVAGLRQRAHEDVVERFSEDINFQKIYEVIM